MGNLYASEICLAGVREKIQVRKESEKKKERKVAWGGGVVCAFFLLFVAFCGFWWFFCLVFFRWGEGVLVVGFVCLWWFCLFVWFLTLPLLEKITYILSVPVTGNKQGSKAMGYFFAYLKG